MSAVTSLKGIVRGFREDNTLRPFDRVTEAEIGKVAAEVDIRGFENDDFKEPWYRDTVNILRRYDINIDPNRLASRADLVDILYETREIKNSSRR
jgi:hypothetical protein